MEKTLVVIPTYNEADNVYNIISAVLAINGSIEVLIIDDGSPDGTADLVNKMKESDHRIHMIRRAEKMGLGTAYVAGFRFALDHDYEYIFEMDADFSHDPGEIPHFLEKIKNYDLVVGSRYLNGVTVVNWPLKRLILSYSANLYTRIITGIPMKDVTAGFKCFRRKVLEMIDLFGHHQQARERKWDPSFDQRVARSSGGDAYIKAGIRVLIHCRANEALYCIEQVKSFTVFHANDRTHPSAQDNDPGTILAPRDALNRDCRERTSDEPKLASLHQGSSQHVGEIVLFLFFDRRNMPFSAQRVVTNLSIYCGALQGTGRNHWRASKYGLAPGCGKMRRDQT